MPSFVPWILPLVLLGLWQASLSFGFVEPYQLTPPLEVLESAGDQWRRGLLQQDILATVIRVVVGFAIGASLGVVLGTITGLSRGIQRGGGAHASRRSALFLRSPRDPCSSCGWASTTRRRSLLVAIGAFFPVYVNLVAGIHGVDRELVEVARIYNLGRAADRPSRDPAGEPAVAVHRASAGVLAGVAVRRRGGVLRRHSVGLGARLTDSQQTTRVDLMLVSMLFLAVLGKVTDTIIVADRATRASVARHPGLGDSAVSRPLVLEGIAKRYGERRRLASVEIEVNAGEIVALVGPSGLWQEHAAPADLRPGH